VTATGPVDRGSDRFDVEQLSDVVQLKLHLKLLLDLENDLDVLKRVPV
jgi:hypothetical protein